MATSASHIAVNSHIAWANCATPLQGPWCHACGQRGEDFHRSIVHLAELFILDERSYRDDNILPDGAGTVLDVRLRNGERRRLAGKPKSLLGAVQRDWLLKNLREAQARGVLWKIIASDDPLSTITGSYQLFAPEGPMTPAQAYADSPNVPVSAP